MLGPNLRLDDWKIVREELAARAADIEARLSEDSEDLSPQARGTLSRRLGIIDNAIKEM